MDADDEALLERIRSGDADGVGVLYDRTRGFLLDAVIRPRVGVAHAEDVLAETFRFALDRLPLFEWRGVGVVRWLAAVAKRKAQETRRRLAVRESRESDLPDGFDVPDGASTAEAEMIRLEALARTRRRVEETLSALAPRYAEALRLRLLEGRERAECAARLAVSVETFDVVLHRAARSFEKRWKENR